MRRASTLRHQWHENFPPHEPPAVPVGVVSVFATVFDSPADSDFASADLVAPSPTLASALAAGFVPELLKSVAYQPLPLSWKPTAEMSLASAGLLHSGQVESGASESFCSISSSCPPAPQRYS